MLAATWGPDGPSDFEAFPAFQEAMEHDRAVAEVTDPAPSGSSTAMAVFIPSAAQPRSSDGLDDAKAILRRHGGQMAAVFLHPDWFAESFRDLALPEGAILAVHDMTGRNLMRYTRDDGDDGAQGSKDPTQAQAQGNPDEMTLLSVNCQRGTSTGLGVPEPGNYAGSTFSCWGWGA